MQIILYLVKCSTATEFFLEVRCHAFELFSNFILYILFFKYLIFLLDCRLSSKPKLPKFHYPSPYSSLGAGTLSKHASHPFKEEIDSHRWECWRWHLPSSRSRVSNSLLRHVAGLI